VGVTERWLGPIHSYLGMGLAVFYTYREVEPGLYALVYREVTCLTCVPVVQSGWLGSAANPVRPECPGCGKCPCDHTSTGCPPACEP
jgi:hypothetical protein